MSYRAERLAEILSSAKSEENAYRCNRGEHPLRRSEVVEALARVFGRELLYRDHAERREHLASFLADVAERLGRSDAHRKAS